MTEIDYVLTFDKGKQTFGNCCVEMFDTKKEAVAFFKGMVTHQKRHLIKVSMCCVCDAPVPSNILPPWYMDCNGKLWSDDLGTVKYNKYWVSRHLLQLELLMRRQQPKWGSYWALKL